MGVTNTTYFAGDGTHLTDAGYAVVASLAQPVIYGLFNNPPYYLDVGIQGFALSEW